MASPPSLACDLLPRCSLLSPSCLPSQTAVATRLLMSLAAEKRRKAKAFEEAGAALSVKLVARSTRGQRISELQGDDAEADETFWGQGAWQEEEEGDSEFSSEEGKWRGGWLVR